MATILATLVVLRRLAGANGHAKAVTVVVPPVISTDGGAIDKLSFCWVSVGACWWLVEWITAWCLMHLLSCSFSDWHVLTIEFPVLAHMYTTTQLSCVDL